MIAYSQDVNSRHKGVWVMDADGGNQRQLTQDGSRPAWSPDGTRIAFHDADVEGSGNGGIWVINIDGTDRRQLTDEGLWPTWVPSTS